MPGLAVLLFSWLSAIAPNGGVLLSAFDSPAAQRHLPASAFTAITPGLWVVFHQNQDLRMAFYSPAEARDPSFWLRAKALEMERLLPGLRVPRIFLYAPYYLEDSRLRPADRMTLDVAQYFSEALLEAVLDLNPPKGFEERARQYGGAEVYVSALAQFGSDVFTIAIELRRALQRQRAAGKNPCIAARMPATLFGRWGQVFTHVQYRGLRPVSSEDGELGPPLSQSDKSFLVEHVFGNFWTGNVFRDFDLECP